MVRDQSKLISIVAGRRDLTFSESEWPITQTPTTVQKLPDNVEVSINIVNKIEEDKHSTFEKLLRVTARVLALHHKMTRTTFKNVTKVLTPEDIANAEQFWILQAQKIVHADLKKGQFNIKASVLENVTIKYIYSGRTKSAMDGNELQ